MQVTQNRLVDCMYLCTDLNISMLVSKKCLGKETKAFLESSGCPFKS